MYWLLIRIALRPGDRLVVAVGALIAWAEVLAEHVEPIHRGANEHQQRCSRAIERHARAEPHIERDPSNRQTQRRNGAGSSGSPMLLAAASGGEGTVTIAVRAPGR